MSKQKKSNSEVTTEDYKAICEQLRQLKEANINLNVALNVAQSRQRKKKYSTYARTQSCKTANSFHVSISSLLSEDFASRLTEVDIISVDEDNTIVISDECANEIKATLKASMLKFRE